MDLSTRAAPLRIGMIVPSSNITMETEIPELLRRQQAAGNQRFSFHSARLRLQHVTPEALALMNESAEGAVDMLDDAQVDALMYACLVAVMVGGKRCISDTGARLAARAGASGRRPAVITSAGALVAALKHLQAARVTLIAPYRKELTARVAASLAEYGIEVIDSRSLEVTDNLQVGRLDPQRLLAIASGMDLSRSHALVLSACVQMPSLDVIEAAERQFGLPVISAATASAFVLLSRLGIAPAIRDAGALLRAAVHAPQLELMA